MSPPPAQVAYTVELFAALPALGLYSLRAADADGTLAGDFFRTLREAPGLATPEEADDFPALLGHLDAEDDADLRTYRQPHHRHYGILRDEGQGAAALPPTNEYQRSAPALADLDVHVDGGLRLYLYPVAARVLVLFGGGFKTTRDPTACPHVAAAFNFAHSAIIALRHPTVQRQWRWPGNHLRPYRSRRSPALAAPRATSPLRLTAVRFYSLSSSLSSLPVRTPDNAAFFELLERPPLYRKILRSMLFDLHTQVNLILERRGMTRTELARKLTKSDAEVSKWFSGTHNLTLESVAKIAAALEEDVMVVPDRPRGYFKRPLVRALAGETVEEMPTRNEAVHRTALRITSRSRRDTMLPSARTFHRFEPGHAETTTTQAA